MTKKITTEQNTHSTTTMPIHLDQGTFEYDAFLSYSHGDGDRVKRIHAALTQTFKLRIFYDEKKIGIGPLHQQCVDGIQQSRILVIVCSRSSLNSDWVLAEHDAMRARDPRGQSIIPIVLDGSKLPQQLDALFWLDFTNHKDDVANAAKLASLLLSHSSQAPDQLNASGWIELGSVSPFQRGGTIPPHKKCYVSRTVDAQLRHLVTEESFIWIQGEYRMGKSSLCARYQDWIPDGWHLSRPALDLCSRDDFWRDFFLEIQRSSMPSLAQHDFSPVRQWQGLRDLVLRTPFILILDEIGACSGAKGSHLLKALLAIREAMPERFKCIAAFKGLPQDYLKGCKCDEPKLSDCWQVISLTHFEYSHVQELADLLPSPIANAIAVRMRSVEDVTGLRPHAVQQLLDRIWRHFEGLVPSSLSVVDTIVDEQLATFSTT